QRQERVPPAAFVREDLAHQHRRCGAVALGAVGFGRRSGGGGGLCLRRQRAGGDQRDQADRESRGHRLPPAAPFLAGNGGGAAAFTNVRIPNWASSNAPSVSARSFWA